MQILEPVDVWVFFKQNKPQPYLFFWRQRPIKINNINLVHASHEGSSIFYHFSVSSDSNFYRLLFNTTSLKWFLEAAEEG